MVRLDVHGNVSVLQTVAFTDAVALDVTCLYYRVLHLNIYGVVLVATGIEDVFVAGVIPEDTKDVGNLVPELTVFFMPNQVVDL